MSRVIGLVIVRENSQPQGRRRASSAAPMARITEPSRVIGAKISAVSITATSPQLWLWVTSTGAAEASTGWPRKSGDDGLARDAGHRFLDDRIEERRLEHVVVRRRG